MAQFVNFVPASKREHLPNFHELFFYYNTKYRISSCFVVRFISGLFITNVGNTVFQFLSNESNARIKMN